MIAIVDDTRTEEELGMEQVRHGGYDWWVLDGEGAPFFGVTIGYGLVHEPLAAYGTLQRFAGAASIELGRPVEHRSGAVSVPEVRVFVGSDVTTIDVRGDRDTLRTVMTRLAGLFSGEAPLVVAAPVVAKFSAAPRDLATRFGVTSVTFACIGDIGIESVGDVEALRRLLDPSGGTVRAVWRTNDRSLMAPLFPQPRAAPPVRDVSLPLLQREAEQGFVSFAPGYALASTVVSRTSDGSAAIRVIAQQLARHLSTSTGRDRGVSVAVVPMGAEMMATIMADEVPSLSERMQTLELFASLPVPDQTLRNAVDWEVAHPSLSREWDRAALDLAPSQPCSLEQVQTELAEAWQRMRCIVEPGMTPPSGFHAAFPDLPEETGEKFRARASLDRLLVGPRVLTQHRRGSAGASDIDRVDLSALALVLEDGTGSYLLIDSRFRTAQIVPDGYWSTPRLRAIVESRSAGVPRLRATKVIDPVPTRDQVSVGRRVIWLSAAALILVIISAVSLFRGNGSHQTSPVGVPAQTGSVRESTDPVIQDVRFGETGTLRSGMQISVGQISTQPLRGQTEVIVPVQICARTKEGVDVTDFWLLFGDPPSLGNQQEALQHPLYTTKVDAGRCIEGNLDYLVPNNQTGFQVRYHGPSGDRLSWRS